MAKFKKKPVEIEAIQFTRETWETIKDFTQGTAHSIKIPRTSYGKATCVIPTLEGEHIATEGDWIIKGVKGEFYPCKPDVFIQTYDQVF